MKFTAIHIFDDDKFIDNAINTSKANQVFNNQIFIVLKRANTNIEYVISSDIKSYDPSDNDDYKDLLNFVREINPSVIFYHALNSIKQRIIFSLNDLATLNVWLIWGYDLYNEWLPLSNKIYERRTRKFLNRNLSYKNAVVRRIKSSYSLYKLFLFSRSNPKFLPKKLRAKLDSFYKFYFEAIRKMHYVIPVVDTEMTTIEDIGISLKKGAFRYVYLEQLLSSIEDVENVVLGNNLMIGNSGAPTSNHLDTLRYVSKIKSLEECEIIVPLSYGGSLEYNQKVKDSGNELFGSRFSALDEFMPLSEYNKILLSCNTFIFNNIRQQAVGNIITVLYLGAKVYLNKKSPVYDYFTNEGIVLYTLDSLGATTEVKLSTEAILENRRILNSIYSFKNVLAEVEELSSNLKNDFVKKIQLNK